MNITPQAALERCDTLMLDMDGTILDLAFDNYIWTDLVPRRYAAANHLTFEDARKELFDKYHACCSSPTRTPIRSIPRTR